MNVYVFKSNIEKLKGGFTNDKTGSNLPTTETEKWIYSHDLDLQPNSPLIGANPQTIINDITKKGFSIQKGKIKTTEKL